ncbi:MAG: hypothetical protein ACTS6J_00360 [Burkholderiales bacterium]
MNAANIIFDCLCSNQDGKTVIDGTAEVLAPTEKIKRERIEMPQVSLLERAGVSSLRSVG